MPRLAEDSDIEDIFQETVAEADTEAKKQINGELEDKVNEEEDELADLDHNEDEDEEAKAKAEDIEDDDDEEGGEGEEYIVEAITDHMIAKGQILYWIKWQGYDDGQNTWEPEGHLLPHSRAILAAYHKKIGGPPELPIKRTKSKQSLKAAASSEDLPARKRQKRNGAREEKLSEEKKEEPVGSWLPTGSNWEDQVEVVETIERNPETNHLMAYVRFTNKKRTKMSMEMVYKHCPRPMLRFYEEHLKFNQNE